jgi:hypothetical protein
MARGALLVAYGLNTITPPRLGELFRGDFVRKFQLSWMGFYSYIAG